MPLASFLARLPQSRTIRVPGTGGVPDRQPGLRADLAAAQSEAQQGAARAGAVRHRAEPRQPEVPATSAPRSRNWRPASIAWCCATASWKAPIFRARWRSCKPRGRRSIRCRQAISSAARCWCRRWRRSCRCGGCWLFLVLARNAVPATEFFRIPVIAWWSWASAWRSDAGGVGRCRLSCRASDLGGPGRQAGSVMIWMFGRVFGSSRVSIDRKVCLAA